MHTDQSECLCAPPQQETKP